MSIIQSKRKVISLIIATMFLVVSIGLNPASVSALSYFFPFEDLAITDDFDELTEVTLNSQADQELGRFSAEDGTQYIRIGKTQKLVMPADGDLSIYARFNYSSPNSEFVSLRFSLDSNAVETYDLALIDSVEKDGYIEFDGLPKGTYYLTAEIPMYLDDYTQELINGTSTTCSFYIRASYSVNDPEKTAITYVKSTKKKAATLKWKKANNATKYQVMVAQNKKFTKAKRVTTTNKQSITFTKLSSKKTYYARVRGYVTVNGNTYYGAYSPIKTVKIK